MISSFVGSIEDGKLSEGKTSTTSNHAMAVVGFHTKRGEQVNIQVAHRLLGDNKAQHNLKEVEGKTFDEVKSEGRKEWNNILGRIEVEDVISTIFALSIVASIAQYFSHVRSMSLTNRVILSIIVLIMAKYYRGYLFTDTGFWDTLPFALSIAQPRLSINE